MSTVILVETYEKVKAEPDANQDVHYKTSGISGNTLCGLKATESTEADVTCYKCHEFSRGSL